MAGPALEGIHANLGSTGIASSVVAAGIEAGGTSVLLESGEELPAMSAGTAPSCVARKNSFAMRASSTASSGPLNVESAVRGTSGPIAVGFRTRRVVSLVLMILPDLDFIE